MSRCPSCGGILGRDCFNPIECAQITHSMNQYDVDSRYIDAIKEAKATIKWMWDNMAVVDSNLQSDAFNLPANTLELLENLVPEEKPQVETSSSNWMDDLPF